MNKFLNFMKTTITGLFIFVFLGHTTILIKMFPQFFGTVFTMITVSYIIGFLFYKIIECYKNKNINNKNKENII